jgi:hypothetical protein
MNPEEVHVEEWGNSRKREMPHTSLTSAVSYHTLEQACRKQQIEEHLDERHFDGHERKHTTRSMRAKPLLSAILALSFKDSSASPTLLDLKKLSVRAIAPFIAVSRLYPSLQVVAQAASPTITTAGAAGVETLHTPKQNLPSSNRSSSLAVVHRLANATYLDVSTFAPALCPLGSASTDDAKASSHECGRWF